MMIKLSKKILFSSIILLGIIGFAIFGPSIFVLENTDRLKLNEAIMMFMEIKQIIEEDIKLDKSIDNADEIHRKWNEVNNNTNRLVDTFILNNNGDVVLISNSMNIAILFSSDDLEIGSWSCSTYPKLNIESLCSKFK